MSLSPCRKEDSTDVPFDVVAFGTLLVDFTSSGISLQGNPLMEANLGGAPCNVLAMLQKLGWRECKAGSV